MVLQGRHEHMYVWVCVGVGVVCVARTWGVYAGLSGSDIDWLTDNGSTDHIIYTRDSVHAVE